MQWHLEMLGYFIFSPFKLLWPCYLNEKGGRKRKKKEISFSQFFFFFFLRAGWQRTARRVREC